MSIGPGQHSPVGASAIKRVLACPASVALATGVEDEESEHATLGTAVHSVIEECFRRDIDAWALVGTTTVEGYPIDKSMANAAQVMLSAVRTAHPDRNQGNFWVERRFHCPTIHPLFFGTSDAVHLETIVDETGTPRRALHIWDYKNGAGVIIEVEDCEQLMYYACGALEDLVLWDKVDTVVLHIVQPNGFHTAGPVRDWATTPDHLAEWLTDTLVPGIEAATAPTGWTGRKCGTCGGHGEVEDGGRCPSCAGTGEEHVSEPPTASGEHCRFCPARTQACPQLMADMAELEVMMAEIEKKGAEALTNDQVARLLDLTTLAKLVVYPAVKKTAFNRISAGARIEGWKLAKSKANRVWKDDVEAAAKAEFGGEAYSRPEMKSPAQIDDLPMGTAFTSRWAYKPDTGLTLVKGTDTRPEVSTDTKSLFTDVTKVKMQVSAPVAPLIPPPANGGRRKPSAQPTV